MNFRSPELQLRRAIEVRLAEPTPPPPPPPPEPVGIEYWHCYSYPEFIRHLDPVTRQWIIDEIIIHKEWFRYGTLPWDANDPFDVKVKKSRYRRMFYIRGCDPEQILAYLTKVSRYNLRPTAPNPVLPPIRYLPTPPKPPPTPRAPTPPLPNYVNIFRQWLARVRRARVQLKKYLSPSSSSGFSTPYIGTPSPTPFPPVGATYRYGYMDMNGLCELNPLNGYDEVLPTVINTQSPLLKGQWLYEQDSRIAVVYQGNVLVYSLNFISPPLLVNTWPLPDNAASGGRLGFYDPNSNCACAVYISLSTPTGTNYGTVNVNTGATTATFYALPSTTNNGVSLIFAQASERCSPTNNFFATISSMFWNGGPVSVWRVCKHSKATGALLGDSGNDPLTDDWKVLNYSLVYVADREEYIACGRSAPFPATLGFNVFNSSLALIQSIPIGEISLAVLAGSRNGGASIFFTQSTVVITPLLSVSTLTRYAHNGVEYVATASVVLSSSAVSADWSSTMNVLWVSHYIETKLYHGTTLALIDTVSGCWGANTLAPD